MADKKTQTSRARLADWLRPKARKVPPKPGREPWNKGRIVGQRDPLTPSQVAGIKKRMMKRGDAGLRDLALFSTAIDTMLRAPDLLGLTVADVRTPDGAVRDTITLATTSRGRAIQCTLSAATRDTLATWIDASGKTRDDVLFTGRMQGGSKAISPRQLSRLVKSWVTSAGLDASAYGTESLRRTRALHILNRTGNLEAVRALLGLADIASTARYLSDSRPLDALAISRSHEL